MELDELVELTGKRIANLTEVELKHSFDCSDDYPIQIGLLLDAIHTRNEYERIGKSLMMFLYSHNEFDINLHEGL